jgi:hypothetical protein
MNSFRRVKSLHFELLYTPVLKLEMTIFAMRDSQAHPTARNVRGFGSAHNRATYPSLPEIDRQNLIALLQVHLLSFTYNLLPFSSNRQRCASFLSGAQLPVKILSSSKPSNNRLLFQQPSAYNIKCTGCRNNITTKNAYNPAKASISYSWFHQIWTTALLQK